MEAILEKQITRGTPAERDFYNNIDTLLYFSVNDIAKIYKITPLTVRKLIKRYDVRGGKVGREWRMTLEDFVYQTAEPSQKPPKPEFFMEFINYGEMHIDKIESSKHLINIIDRPKLLKVLSSYSFQYTEKWKYLHRHGLD
ncbi:helix-turn-helix domain-containing protein [Nanoarchaeota archaeon]